MSEPKSVRKIREGTGMTQAKFAEMLGIPIKTYANWEQGRNPCPAYVYSLIAYRVTHDPKFDKPRKNKRAPHTMRRICEDCGEMYVGGTSSKYCPDCRKKRGYIKRPLGSIDICKVCGREYTVTGTSQKRCHACAAAIIKKRSRARGMAVKSPCLTCGVELPVGVMHFCSLECERERYKRMLELSQEERGFTSSGNLKSGIPGITWKKDNQRWQVYRRRVYLGCHATLEAAVAALEAAATAEERGEK